MQLAGYGTIKLYADGADSASIVKLAEDPIISGFTTNPTLMRKAGVDDYESFARAILEQVTAKPISFEVFSDEPRDMARQAKLLASWGDNVFVKIPITNTLGSPTSGLVRELTQEGLKLNITAIMTQEQVLSILDSLEGTTGAVISVFAGRAADAGVDPLPLMSGCKALINQYGGSIELLWASPREILNLVQAIQVDCDIITMTSDLIAKVPLLGKPLEEYSLETVRMFYTDADAAGYSL